MHDWLSLIVLGILFGSCVPKRELGGIDLRMAVVHDPPFNYIRLEGVNYTAAYGTNTNIFEWLARRLNFTITLVPVVDQALIAKMGTYEAAVSKVITTEVEGVICSFVITPARAQVMDYTCGIIWSEPYSLVAPAPKYKSRLFAFILPFKPSVWLGMGFSLTVFVGVMTYFSLIYYNTVFKSRLTRKKSDKTVTAEISNNFIYVVCILTNHGAYSSFYHNSYRILAGSWLLAAFVLVNSYSSIVVSSLTVPVLEPAINSFEDLVSNTKVSMIVHKTVILTKLILDANSGTLYELGNQLRRHPELLLLDFTSAYKKVEEGHYALPWLTSSVVDFVATRYRKYGKCRFLASDPLPVAYFTAGTLWQKHFKYTSAISFGLMELWETGLTRHWIKNMSPQADECLDKHPPKSTTAVPIKLVDLTSAFLVFGLGIGISLLTFLGEKLYFKFIGPCSDNIMGE